MSLVEPGMKPEQIIEACRARRFKSAKRKVYRREIDRMLDEQRDESALTNSAASPSRMALFKHKAKSFFKDLNYYIDFCLARLIVWRELRRERKKAKSLEG